VISATSSTRLAIGSSSQFSPTCDASRVAQLTTDATAKRKPPVILAAVCTELLLRLLDSVGVFEVVAMVVAALAVGRPPLPLRLRRLRLHTTAMPSFNLATAVALSCQPSAHIHMHAAIHKSHIRSSTKSPAADGQQANASDFPSGLLKDCVIHSLNTFLRLSLQL
jgi:hypothetical protein